MDEETPKPYGLPYIKLYVDEIELMEAQLAPEVAALLIYAVGNYAKDGTERKVPTEIQYAFADFRRKVDLYRKKGEKTSKARAAAGRKGGEAKAANAKAQAEKDDADKATFTPPSKAAFQKLVFSIIEEEDFDRVEQYDVEEFYDFLKRHEWKIMGAPLKDKEDLVNTIWAKFGNAHHRYHVPSSYLFAAYEKVFAYNREHNTYVDETDLFQFYFDKKANTFTVDGNVFSLGDWDKALDAFLSIQSKRE